MKTKEAIRFRQEVLPDDVRNVRVIVESSGFFHGHEIEVAVELVEERLAKGIRSGYHFIFAELEGKTVGYTCYGEIAVTEGSYDLYWIAVLDAFRSRGVGGKLLVETEQAIRALGGRAIWVETSSRPLYEPTRQFYLRHGYPIEAVLKDFYAAEDDKVIFVKRLP